MITCGDILEIIDEKAPFRRGEDWDNTGLLVGDPRSEVHKILFALNVTQDVVDEAVELGADLIVSHHPLLFSPISNLRWDTYKGKLLKALMKNEIAVLCAHTNVDVYPKGINGFLAEKLELTNCEPLRLTSESSYYKLNVFIPTDSVEEVLSALFDAGAGKLGFYESCAFRQEGLGQFRPIGPATPFIGETDVLEIVEETKVEVVVPLSVLENVLTALLDAHPYEEPAYDLFLLQNKLETYGLGVVGEWKRPLDFHECVEIVKEALGIEQISCGGDVPKTIQRVALCSGSGSDLMDDAIHAGADLYITSDLKYHDGQKALEEGLFVMDVGHHASEVFSKGLMCAWVEEATANEPVELFLSERETDYFRLC